MTLKRWDGASWTDLTFIKRWSGSAWVDLTTLKRWSGSAWVAIPLPGGGGSGLSATVNDSSVFGVEFRAPHAAPAVLTVVSNTPATVTVTAIAGTGPYTYSWSHLSGDSAVQVNSPNAATTSFVGNIGKNQSKTAIKRCTVTDSLSATAHVDISVTLEYNVEF